MSKFWSPLAQSLEPYVPGEQPKDKKYVKLNTNENPYPPSPKAMAAMQAHVNSDLRLYPDPTCADLVQAAADFYGVSPKQTFVGNGSDEILALAFMAFFDPAKPVMFPDITYSFYKVYAKLCGLTPKLITLDEQFKLPIDLFAGNQSGIILPNPNAPTAELLPLSAIRTILEQNRDQVVVIDEAYIDFGGESAVSLINEYDNLLVIQTLSKSRALAGLRVGTAYGSEQLIEGLDRVKNSFNSYTLDRLALAGAIAAYEDRSYLETTVQKVVMTREWTKEQLIALGFTMTDSQANFLFITHERVPAEQIFLQLREKGVLVRYFKQPRIDNYLRVTIGTDEEMQVLVDGIREIVSK
ncbi:histidinol-phosphate transaminase [Paenibacillus yanchengensis]|uniref:Histidinol-phosphate aminotransferase n=1 Tax=Paenibacillus yanchengensis TaxID=2035833 RepID=A0ABW4YMX5_9BACL